MCEGAETALKDGVADHLADVLCLACLGMDRGVSWQTIDVPSVKEVRALRVIDEEVKKRALHVAAFFGSALAPKTSLRRASGRGHDRVALTRGELC